MLVGFYSLLDIILSFPIALFSLQDSSGVSAKKSVFEPGQQLRLYAVVCLQTFLPLFAAFEFQHQFGSKKYGFRVVYGILNS